MKAMTVNLKGLGYSINDLKDEIIKNWRMFLLTFLFIGGMISGSAIYKNFGDNFSRIIAEDFSEILEYKFTKIFIILLCTAVIPIIISFFNSFNALGMPVILAIPALYGFALSILTSFLYINYKKDGVIFALILIFPAAIINTLLLIAANNESLILSRIVSRNIFFVNKESRGERKDFFLRYSIITLITAVICAADSLAITAVGDSLLF